MKLSKVHVIITSGLTQISVVFCFERKYISEFCLRVYTSTVNSRRLAYAPFEFYFQHLWHNLASRAQSLTRVWQTCQACETLLHRIFWRFDISHFDTKNGFSESGWGITDAYRLSPSFLPLIFAGSLFHCSLTIFARLPWPRARHRLTQRPESRLNFHFAL